MSHQANSELASAGRPRALRGTGFLKAPPPHVYFIVSAVFHYLGPSFAVLLFARVQVLGVAWLRIASAGLIFAAWRRPWGVLQGLDRDGRRLLVAWGAVLAVMNCCFYEAINRLPLGDRGRNRVPARDRAGGTRSSHRSQRRRAVDRGPGRVPADARRSDRAAARARVRVRQRALFATYIVLAHRVAQHPSVTGIDGLAVAMLIAAVVVTPLGGWQVVGVLKDPVALLAGIGVGVSSSVIPYVTDQLAMARLPRATYALMVSLLPATATVVGIVVLTQIPTVAETIGVGLVIAGVALHRDP